MLLGYPPQESSPLGRGTSLVGRATACVRRAARRLVRRCTIFAADRGGNTTIIFAIAVIPIFGSVGAAVDYSRANNARTAMQAALDATALMISKQALDLKTDQVQAKARAYFNAMFNRPDIKSLKITFSLQTNAPGDFTVLADGAGKIDTAFVRLLGVKQMPIRTTAQVRWGFRTLEVALALDNTGSMAQKNKITELKSAVKLLLSTLKTNSKMPDDTKIAIIPFNTVVNIGASFKDKSWIAYGSGITSTNWSGCIADRDQPNDVRDTVPSGASSYYPAVSNCGSLAKIIPLTNDWGALEGMVDTMTPVGTTNVTIGAMWAWSALSTSEPFTEGKTVRPDVEKVIILLTDGLNTQNRFTTTASLIDARTEQVCANIKKAGIRMYVVRVIEGNTALLQGCATSPSMYYDVQVSSQLKDVFASIASSLTGARLAK
jgi:Flp pilus assembly protein TadG